LGGRVILTVSFFGVAESEDGMSSEGSSSGIKMLGEESFLSHPLPALSNICAGELTAAAASCSVRAV
jgi:hypothetical protein